jgi:hypothetical protein
LAVALAGPGLFELVNTVKNTLCFTVDDSSASNINDLDLA